MLTSNQKQLLKLYTQQEKDKAVLSIYPFRYEFLEEKDESLWKLKDKVIFEATLISTITNVYIKGKLMTQFKVSTLYNEYRCIVFNQPFLKKMKMNEDGKITIIGTLFKPDQIVVSSISNKSLESVLGIKPIYPLIGKTKQHQIRSLVQKVVKQEKSSLLQLDYFSDEIKQQFHLKPHGESIIEIHTPTDKQKLSQAIYTLKFEEALWYYLALTLDQTKQKKIIKEKQMIDSKWINDILSKIPYVLTPEQSQALNDIVNDFSSEQAKRRLLLGDVGSGKTIVALITAYLKIKLGYKVILCAPTEVLASQHFENANKLLQECYLLTGNTSNDEKNYIYHRMLQEKPCLLIGTHALFNDELKVQRLGYVILDEQHRFGVNQRKTLIEKGEAIDVLMLSATPIPRTLASTLYAHLEVSSIMSYPKNRGVVKSFFIEENSIQSVVDTILKRIENGDQVYVVASTIELDNKLNVQSVEKLTRNLTKAFPNLKIRSISSKTDPHELNSIIQSFKKHEFDILVTTTVIEVGIDIPNANTMIIYNGERFGLSTLHQLRGRIGRGEKDAVCYVLSSNDTIETKQRLNYFVSHTSGYELSMADLKLRGSGDLLGVRQSGFPSFALLDLTSDQEILANALKLAQQLIDKNHSLVKVIEQKSNEILNTVAI